MNIIEIYIISAGIYNIIKSLYYINDINMHICFLLHIYHQ